MNLGDDLVTAGVGALAALLGAWIGATATRRASLEAFDRVARREDEAWRKALHHECWLNINLDKDQRDGLWSGRDHSAACLFGPRPSIPSGGAATHHLGQNRQRAARSVTRSAPGRARGARLPIHGARAAENA